MQLLQSLNQILQGGWEAGQQSGEHWDAGEEVGETEGPELLHEAGDAALEEDGFVEGGEGCFRAVVSGREIGVRGGSSGTGRRSLLEFDFLATEN